MKKLILFIVFLILFSGYFFIVPKNIPTMAAVCGGICKSNAECPEDCPVCRTEQLNLESAQIIGMDCQYINTCYCFGENFKPISEEGSEQIVPYTQPLLEEKTTTEIPDLTSRINKVVNYSTGIGGLVAFILIIIGALQIILSAGNPDRVKAGKEMITSAIAGLLLIIFAVFILRLIGYDILRIPGFGE